MSEYDIGAIRTTYKAHLELELAKVSSYEPATSMLEGQWAGMVWPASPDAKWDPETGVEGDVLSKVGRGSVAIPEGFVSLLYKRKKEGCGLMR